MVALLMIFPALLEVLEAFGEDPRMAKWIFWLIIAYFSLLVVVSVWGLIGVALSSLSRQAERVAAQGVVVSTQSWYYKLSTAMSAKTEPHDGISHCEYHARFWHGLSLTPWIVAWNVIAAVVLLVGWLLSARPSFSYEEPWFKKGSQPVGPIVLGCIILGLAIAFLPGDFWALVLLLLWAFVKVVGGFTAVVFAGIVVLGICILLAERFVWPPVCAIARR